jgi:hypothetical protein
MMTQKHSGPAEATQHHRGPVQSSHFCHIWVGGPASVTLRWPSVRVILTHPGPAIPSLGTLPLVSCHALPVAHIHKGTWSVFSLTFPLRLQTGPYIPSPAGSRERQQTPLPLPAPPSHRAPRLWTFCPSAAQLPNGTADTPEKSHKAQLGTCQQKGRVSSWPSRNLPGWPNLSAGRQSPGLL